MKAPEPLNRPLRALIIDDEPLAREGIRMLVSKDQEIAVIGEADNGRDAVDAIRSMRPDLIFLDVQMPEKDGLDVLRDLPADQLPIVVFVTAFDKYAIDAFEAHALDYLLKPVAAGRFAHTLDRVKARFRERQLSEVTERLLMLLKDGTTLEPPVQSLERFAVPVAGKIQLVNVDDVDWIEAEDDYLRLHAGKSSHLIRKTLSALEQELDRTRFARIHRSMIVNVARIKELHTQGQGEYAVILRDGTRLKLSKTYRSNLAHLLP